MTKTDGEQELVLGNKQLLSAFFIVVVLLGVFFTMGYIIGRNTASLTPKTEPNAATASTVARPDPPPNAVSVRPDPPVETPKELDPVATSATPTTQAARPYGRPVTDATETAPARHDEGATVAAAPGAGTTYLQVAALKRPEAEIEVKILRDHKFPALIGESPKEGFFRVLVGPFKDMQSLARTKSELKSAGFDSIVQK